MRILDRAGIFRAKPFEWSVVPSANSKSVAICVGVQITAQWDGGEWQSWAEAEEHQTAARLMRAVVAAQPAPRAVPPARAEAAVVGVGTRPGRSK